MIALDGNSMPVYECPTCRKILTQEWFQTDVGALQKTNQLLRQRLADDESDEEEPAESIFEAINVNNLSRVQEYIVDDPSLINYQDDMLDTPLIDAARCGHLSIVEYLFEHGADINATNINGSTALMSVAISSDLTVVEYLVEHGADINATNNRGMTALLYASGSGTHSVVEYLVEQGADVLGKDNEGLTALLYASHRGHHTIVDYLERAVNASSNDGNTTI